MNIQDFLLRVEQERKRQIEKFGSCPNHTLDKWGMILMEEVGEVSKAINEGDKNNLVEELIQVATVCLAILQESELNRENGDNSRVSF